MSEKIISYEDIERVNGEISTMGIDKKNSKTGKTETKQYAEVNQRVLAFRKLHPNGTITTDLQVENGVCIAKAQIADETGRLLATGTAYEKEGSTFINKTSYIENAETSAIGRALGFCGIGIIGGIASYEEVANAMLQQNAPAQPQTNAPQPPQNGKVDYRLMLLNELKKRGVNVNEYAKEKGINGNATQERYIELLKEMGVLN